MEILYIVQHTHELTNDLEDVKIIGIFDNLDSAENAVEILKKKPGFSSCTDGFHIDKYELNNIHWLEGFNTL